MISTNAFELPSGANAPTQSTGGPEFQQNFFGRFISSLLCLFTPVADMLQQDGLKDVDGRAEEMWKSSTSTWQQQHHQLY